MSDTELDTGFEAYKAAHARWQEWLGGDSEHAISRQLSQLFWQDAAFRVFNEARKFAIAGKPSSAVAPILARFIDQGYVAGQVLGISKLVEWSNPKHRTKGVISLKRLVDDLLAHRHLLTRANYLAVHDLPYDPEPARAAAFKSALQEVDRGNFRWEQVGGQEDYEGSIEAHQQFDRLSGVAPNDRRPEDVIAEATLKKLESALEDGVFDQIKTYRHKTLAHAADAYSRKAAADLPKGVKFEQIDRALWLLTGVLQMISATILQESWRGSAVPTPQYDQLEYLELPYVAAEGVSELREFWRKHCDVRDDWLSEAYNSMLP